VIGEERPLASVDTTVGHSPIAAGRAATIEPLGPTRGRSST